MRLTRYLSLSAILLGLLGACVPITIAEEPGANRDIYFPAKKSEWKRIDPSHAGWNIEKLKQAFDYAEENRSTGIVLLSRGRLLAEHYMDLQGVPAAAKRRVVLRTDDLGHTIEDVASCQKSVVSVLVGIAQQKGLLKIDQPVSQYLGEGWSQAKPEQESAIRIRHLLTMTSGLTDRGTFQAPAGTRWKYNTPIYSKLMDVLIAATGMDRNAITNDWITGPLGMSDSSWVERRSPDVQSVNKYGFATSARDLARFGLMMSANGNWGDQVILSDQEYLRDATTTSQKLNPFYGYLWWLNRNAFKPQGPRRIQPAPRDMYSANGAGNRRCWVVPSLDLVVTRLGAPPTDGKDFDRELWKRLMAARQ